MTRNDIEFDVREVALLAIREKDDEAAHRVESRLHVDVLRAISLGALVDISPEEAAAMALSTLTIDFARWCA